jgi:hypothetical protein
VAGEQADGVPNWFGSRREGRSSPKGFSMMEGFGGGEEMATSRSRGHRQSLRGQGGCTRRRGAWDGVETVRGGLEQAVRSGSV